MDLFSGIGGLTKGTEPWCRATVLCDVNPDSRALLAKHFPDVPIKDDVRTIGDKIPDDVSFDLIGGGFPCQDISSTGGRSGLNGARSGLFHSVMSLADKYQPPFLLLENVRNIILMKSVWEIVLDELHARGYDARWVVIGAGHLGAPHLRERWFCLAVKRGIAPQSSSHRECVDPAVFAERLTQPWNAWDDTTTDPLYEPKGVPRMDERYEKRRHQFLGNAVCPAQAKTAFPLLFGGFGSDGSSVEPSCDMKDHILYNYHASAPQFVGTIVDKNVLKSLPKFGAMVNGEIHELVMPVRLSTKDYKLVCDPKYNVESKNIIPENNKIKCVNRRKIFATPRAYFSGSSHVLTRRGACDLGTQLRFEHGTAGDTGDDRKKRIKVHVNYSEWMMGFERDYTM